ncbi:MAG: hypothetical protein JXA67_11730 [Micromonosporaceae bacterium]|nr:hypothetical protein [Micromonosporaceae bacterium]
MDDLTITIDELRVEAPGSGPSRAWAGQGQPERPEQGTADRSGADCAVSDRSGAGWSLTERSVADGLRGRVPASLGLGVPSAIARAITDAVPR